MAEIAARLEEGPYDYIDVNMGLSGAENCQQRRRPGSDEKIPERAKNPDRHGEKR